MPVLVSQDCLCWDFWRTHGFRLTRVRHELLPLSVPEHTIYRLFKKTSRKVEKQLIDGHLSFGMTYARGTDERSTSIRCRAACERFLMTQAAFQWIAQYGYVGI